MDQEETTKSDQKTYSQGDVDALLGRVRQEQREETTAALLKDLGFPTVTDLKKALTEQEALKLTAQAAEERAAAAQQNLSTATAELAATSLRLRLIKAKESTGLDDTRIEQIQKLAGITVEDDDAAVQAKIQEFLGRTENAHFLPPKPEAEASAPSGGGRPAPTSRSVAAAPLSPLWTAVPAKQ